MFWIFIIQSKNILKNLPATGLSTNNGDQNGYASSPHDPYSLILWEGNNGRVHVSGPIVLQIKLGKWDFMTKCRLKEYTGRDIVL